MSASHALDRRRGAATASRQAWLQAHAGIALLSLAAMAFGLFWLIWILFDAVLAWASAALSPVAVHRR